MLIQLSLPGRDTLRRGDVVRAADDEALGVVTRAAKDGGWVDVRRFGVRKGKRLTDLSAVERIGSIFTERM